MGPGLFETLNEKSPDCLRCESIFGSGFFNALLNTYKELVSKSAYKVNPELERIISVALDWRKFYDGTKKFVDAHNQNSLPFEFEGDSPIQFYNDKESETLMGFINFLLHEQLVFAVGKTYEDNHLIRNPITPEDKLYDIGPELRKLKQFYGAGNIIFRYLE